MVFFDDGHVQYVAVENIRVVFGTYNRKHVHKNASDFYDYYFKSVRTEKLIEIRGKPDGFIRCFLHGEFELAQIVECQRSGTVLLKYDKSNYVESVYVGSPRLEPVWVSIIRNERLKRFYDANMTKIVVSSDSEDDEELQSPKKYQMPIGAKELPQKTFLCVPKEILKNYKPPKKFDRKHTCDPKCVEDYESNSAIFEYDPLKRPLLAGWERSVSGLPHYTAPCGRKYNTIESLLRYLLLTDSKLTIDCFTFSSNINCLVEVRTRSKNKDYLNNVSIECKKNYLFVCRFNVGSDINYITS